MKKNKGICLFLCLCLLLQSVLSVSATDIQQTTGATGESAVETTAPEETKASQKIEYVDHMAADDSVTHGCRTLDSSIALLGNEKLLRSARAAFLYETNSDTVLYAYNADEKVYPSSIVKVMTALLAVEQGDLAEEVTVTPLALSAVPADALIVGLKPGEKITLNDLLYCMMTGSANDAAAVIADHISGSPSSFVKEMNRRAAELGCTNTNFVNAHGLHDDEQYTSARDVCRIMEVAMALPAFMEYFSATSYTVPATNVSEERSLQTTNYMLLSSKANYYDSRITGGRTGITEEGKRCLVTTVEDEGMNYVAVVMDSETIYDSDGSVKRFGSYEETKDLIKLVDDNDLAYRQIMSGGQIIEQYPVENGTSHVAVGPAADVGSVLPSGVGLEDITIRYLTVNEALTAPVALDQPISAMQVWYDDICLAQSNLVAKNAVSVKSQSGFSQPGEKDGEKDNSAFWKTVGIVAVIVAVAVAVALFVRNVNEKKRRAEESRKRRAQRRGR